MKIHASGGENYYYDGDKKKLVPKVGVKRTAPIVAYKRRRRKVSHVTFTPTEADE